jgi:hypothetical protein
MDLSFLMHSSFRSHVEIPCTVLVDFLCEKVILEQKLYRDTFYFQNTFCRSRALEAVKHA